MKKLIAEKAYTVQLEINRIGAKMEIVKLDKTQILIGRSSQADVVIVEGDISRKHLLIEREGDKIFLTDQGSANGSFIGEEKMNPQERIEFSTFFMPIKLGRKVTISLSLEEVI